MEQMRSPKTKEVEKPLIVSTSQGASGHPRSHHLGASPCLLLTMGSLVLLLPRLLLGWRSS